MSKFGLAVVIALVATSAAGLPDALARPAPPRCFHTRDWNGWTSRAGIGLTGSLPVEPACALVLHLQDCVGNLLWKAGAPVVHEPFVAGSIILAHLQDEPCLDLQDPFENLLVHMPQIAFDELVDDHVAFAICARLASRYGGHTPLPARRAGALNARQERLAKAALVADLTREPELASVAQVCGMPVGRFIRAFRLTTGMPPFRWLRAFRVERAKDLLLNSPLAPAQIAYDCGFADQSHFTRVFIAAVGVTPGAWRSARRA